MKSVTQSRITQSPSFRRTTLSALVLAALMGSACSSTGSKDPYASYNSAFATGDYEAAAASLTPEEGDNADENNAERNVLQLLYVAEAQRLSGNYEGAISTYERVEEGLKKIDLEGRSEKAMEGVAAFAGAKNDYEPFEAEKILINTYMGLAYLSLGQAENARIQFERSEARTARSIESFERKLAEVDSTKYELPGGGPLIDLNALMPTSALASIEERNAKLLEREGEDGHNSFRGYDGFMVPVSRYLAGIYNLAMGDKGDEGTAQIALRSLHEMYPDNEVFEKDFNDSESRRGLTGKNVWVLYENGQAPGLISHKDDIDMAINTKEYDFNIRENSVESSAWKNSVQSEGLNPYVLSIAVPGVGEAEDAGELDVQTNKGAEPLNDFSDMGLISASELDKTNEATAKKAFAIGALKVVAQAVAADKAEAKHAGLGGFAARVAGTATSKSTNADTRSWGTLPKKWEATRFERPSDNMVVLNGQRVQLPSDWDQTLVYVKRPTSSSPLSISIIDLKGENKAVEVTR